MSSELKVLVYGTGFAGQGHVDAFRAAGATVVGVVGRTAEVVADVAKNKDIPFHSTDWQQALAVCQPDVVSIGTPGGAHFEPIVQAIELGCHVFVDKPMTHSGNSAIKLYKLAKKHNIKTAYAASYRYSASVMHAKRLVAEGIIGEPTEVESISHFNLERDIPFGWSHSKESGGGRLNNNFTHSLSIVTSVVGEKILSIMGDVRDDLGKAPIVEGVHNFTTRRNFIPKDLNDPALEWGISDVEWSYTVLAKIQSAYAKSPVSVLFKHGGLVPRFNDDHIIFYGTAGAIHLKGHYGSGQLSVWGQDKQWKAVPTPKDIQDSIPNASGETEQCWQYLVRDFVNDINGEMVEPYPGFKEGCQYQQLIDIIRKSENWTNVEAIVASGFENQISNP